ncbi:hypothetical protein LVJ94_45220 [Pendulispora rubella]|uniref:Uncharacterized protein n=1 Tax=Pendulispora rubella TaxID=2741070 RepID=A0ABZ2L025_9BACT
MSPSSRFSCPMVQVVRISSPPLHFHVCRFADAWRLSEESGAFGGLFTSIDAALAYAHDESRHAPGSSTVIDE